MKRIKIDNNTKEELIKKFKTYLDSAKLTDSNIYYSTTLDSVVDKAQYPKANLYISAIAYLKMMLYVRDTSTEIAWHGTVTRHGKNTFQITDVMLYPQTVTGTTVNTDQDKYNEWIQDLDDDTHNTMRLQGHSHVNMGVTPSGTDMTFYNDILQVLPNDDYYIFMIMNKQGNHTFLIYDLAENIIYENADINYSIINDTKTQTIEQGFTEILDEIETQKEEYCTSHSYTYISPNSTYSKNLTPYSQHYSVPKKSYTNMFNDDDDITGVNCILDDIDRKFKNATLKGKTTKRSKK